MKLVDAAVKAFNKAGDVVERVTYLQLITPSYDVLSGVTLRTTKKIPVEAIFLNITEEQKSLVDLVKGDMLVLLAGKNVLFVPELNDKIVRNKDTYTVVGIKNDPVGALITLQVRL